MEKKLKENKNLNYVQDNTNIRKMAMVKITNDLRMELNRKKKQKWTHPERPTDYLIKTSTPSRKSPL